jgi:hypothetical protein
VRNRQGCHCGFEFLSIPPKSLDKLRQVVRGATRISHQG